MLLFQVVFSFHQPVFRDQRAFSSFLVIFIFCSFALFFSEPILSKSMIGRKMSNRAGIFTATRRLVFLIGVEFGRMRKGFKWLLFFVCFCFSRDVAERTNSKQQQAASYKLQS